MQNFLDSLNRDMLNDERAFLQSFGEKLVSYNNNFVKEIDGKSLDELKHKIDDDYSHFKDTIREFMQNTIGKEKPKVYEGLCMKVKIVALTKQKVLFAELEKLLS